MARQLPERPGKRQFRDPKRGNSNWRCICHHKKAVHQDGFKGCGLCICKQFHGIVTQMFR